MIDLGWIGWLMPLMFGFGFGGSAPSSPPPPPPPPQKSDAEIQAEKAKNRKAGLLRQGRGASILTADGTNFLQPSDQGGKQTLG